MSRGARLACLVLVLTGCGGPAPTTGSQVFLVSLVPSVTEIIYALGAGERLVGNTASCDWPPEARSVLKVGSFYQPDVERIAGLRPALVFVTLPVQRPALEKLRELGFRCYVSDPHDIAGLFGEVESVGRLLGRQAAADSLVAALKTRLAVLPAWRDTPGVYVEVSDSPLITAGAGTFLDEAVRLAGGRNIFGDVGRQYPQVSAEEVVRLDPEVIVLVHPGSSPDGVRSRLGWGGVAAVREGRIVGDIDEDLLARPGPRLVAGIEQLARRLHPTGE